VIVSRLPEERLDVLRSARTAQAAVSPNPSCGVISGAAADQAGQSHKREERR